MVPQWETAASICLCTYLRTVSGSWQPRCSLGASGEQKYSIFKAKTNQCVLNVILSVLCPYYHTF
jgi:hypothetical protein